MARHCEIEHINIPVHHCSLCDKEILGEPQILDLCDECKKDLKALILTRREMMKQQEPIKEEVELRDILDSCTKKINADSNFHICNCGAKVRFGLMCTNCFKM
jgi:hypothetical protein